MKLSFMWDRFLAEQVFFIFVACITFISYGLSLIVVLFELY